MASPRDVELKYRAVIEAELRKKHMEELVQTLGGKRVSPRILEGMNVESISDLTADQIEHLRNVLGLNKDNSNSLPQQVNVDVSSIATAVKEEISKTLSEVISRMSLMAGDSAKTPTSDRPQIDKVFIDPSDNTPVNSNIDDDIGKVATTGETLTDKLAMFKKIKGKES